MCQKGLTLLRPSLLMTTLASSAMAHSSKRADKSSSRYFQGMPCTTTCTPHTQALGQAHIVEPAMLAHATNLSTPGSRQWHSQHTQYQVPGHGLHICVASVCQQVISSGVVTAQHLETAGFRQGLLVVAIAVLLGHALGLLCRAAAAPRGPRPLWPLNAMVPVAESQHH